MRTVKYNSLLLKKKNMYQTWLILYNKIIIPVERIFMDKIILAPGALRLYNYYYIFFIFYYLVAVHIKVLALMNLYATHNIILYSFYYFTHSFLFICDVTYNINMPSLILPNGFFSLGFLRGRVVFIRKKPSDIMHVAT